jgi:hypothetical protein
LKGLWFLSLSGQNRSHSSSARKEGAHAVR